MCIGFWGCKDDDEEEKDNNGGNDGGGRVEKNEGGLEGVWVCNEDDLEGMKPATSEAEFKKSIEENGFAFFMIQTFKSDGTSEHYEIGYFDGEYNYYGDEDRYKVEGNRITFIDKDYNGREYEYYKTYTLSGNNLQTVYVDGGEKDPYTITLNFKRIDASAPLYKKALEMRAERGE